MRSVKDLQVEGKKIFVRVDYNLPMDEDGNITDDNRIVATLDLIKYLVENQAKVILASHLGRPKNGPEANSAWHPPPAVCPSFWDRMWPLPRIASDRRWPPWWMDSRAEISCCWKI